MKRITSLGDRGVAAELMGEIGRGFDEQTRRITHKNQRCLQGSSTLIE